MSGNDQEINVKIAAKIGELVGGVNQAKSKIGEISESAGSLVEAFVGIGGTIASAFAADKLIEFGKHLAEIGDSLQDMSEMTGLAVSSIQSLGFVMKSSGGDAEGGYRAIMKFERAIADARSGSEETVAAFNRLGISQKELKKDDLNTILAKTAEAFHNTADGVEKTDLAMQLFGRAGAGIIPFLNRGAEGVAELQGRFRDLGAELSGKEVSSFVALHEALVENDAAFSAMTSHIGGEFAPVIEFVIKGFTDLAEGINKSITEGGFLKGVLDTIVEVMKAIAAVISFVTSGFEEMWDVAIGGAAAFVALLNGDVKNAMALFKQGWERANAVAAKNANDVFGEGSAQAGGGGEKKNPFGTKPKSGAADEAMALQKEITKGELDEANARYEIAKELLAKKKALGEIDALDEINALRKLETDKYNIERNSLTNSLNAMKRKPVEYQKTLNQIHLLELKHAKDMTQLERQEAEQHRQIWNKYAQPITSAFGTAVSSILNGTATIQEAMLSMVQSIVSAFVNMAAEMVAQWLFAQIFGETSSKTEALTSISSDAARAGAAAYASTAAIPIIGPELAPAAAAAAMAGAGAYAGLVPLAVGAWEIPKDMPAMLHKGETVVPKTFAEGMRGGRGNMGGASITINAVDAKSVQRLLSSNGGALAKEMARQVRQHNPVTKRR